MIDLKELREREYFEVGKHTTTLDGRFTANELRAIIADMEKSEDVKCPVCGDIIFCPNCMTGRGT